MQKVDRNDKLQFNLAVSRKFYQKYLNAQNRKIEFDLNLTTIRNLLRAKTCPYTGITMHIYVGMKQGDTIPDDSLSIERVDNDKGYVKGNVIAVSHKANKNRGDISPKQIEKMYKLMKKRGLL